MTALVPSGTTTLTLVPSGTLGGLYPVATLYPSPTTLPAGPVLLLSATVAISVPLSPN